MCASQTHQSQQTQPLTDPKNDTALSSPTIDCFHPNPAIEFIHGRPPIDYSSWSPRNYQLRLCPQQIWIPKILKVKTPQTSLLGPPPPPFPSQPSLSDNNSHSTMKKMTDYKGPISLATENPPQNLWLIRLLTQIHPLSISCPIPINLLPPYENLSDDRTWKASKKKPPTIRLFPTLPVPPLHKKNEVLDLPLAKVYANPALMLLYAFCKTLLAPFLSPLTQSPQQEITPLSHGPATDILNQVQQLTPLPPKQTTGCSAPTQTGSSGAFDNSLRTILTHAPRLSYLSAPEDSSAPEDPSLLVDPTGSLRISTPNLTETHALLSSLSSNISQEVVPMDLNLSPNVQQSDPGQKGKRSKQKPTRRSQRIRDKRNVTSDAFKKCAERKPRNKKLDIPFEATPSQPPLDISKTLAILQATGLQISKKVEEMIEEASKKDQGHGEIDRSRPTTPLHDPVPPMTVPQFDLPL